MKSLHLPITTLLETLIRKLGGMDLFFLSSGIGSQNPDLKPEIELNTARTNVEGFTRMVTAAFNHSKPKEVNLTGYSRVNAYMLVPDGEGPFPAVVLLHDHGGHYTIGKEKMIRPFGVSPEVLADADAWAKQCYGG